MFEMIRRILGLGRKNYNGSQYQMFVKKGEQYYPLWAVMLEK